MKLRPRSGTYAEPSENSGVIAPATSSKPTCNSEGTVSRNSAESDPGAPVAKSTSNGSPLEVPAKKLSSAKVSELMLTVSDPAPSRNGPNEMTPNAGSGVPPRSIRPISELTKSAGLNTDGIGVTDPSTSAKPP